MQKLFSAVAQIATVAAIIALGGTAAAQQPYPNRAIRVIIPYAPGGSIDPIARIIGQKLTESWGQQVIMDNRPGGNTIIGTEALVKSPPDGYTILLVANPHVTVPLLIPTSYDPIKDFAAVATVYSSGSVLVVHPSIPANNLQEFIALAKSRPGKLNYASTGHGSPAQLATELFGMTAGIKMQHIPYKSSGLGITDLIGGQIHVYLTSVLPAIPHIKSGRLKAIAYAGETRLPALPQVPTFTEAGLPGFSVKIWFGLLVPAGTPKQIIDKLSTEIGRILATPDTRKKLVSLGVEPMISTSDQFAALLKSELTRYGEVIKAANIKLEQ